MSKNMETKNPKQMMMESFKPDLESITPYIQRLLPWKGAVERFVQMTELAIRRNFDLLACNRNSFLLSLIWCAQKNLEPGVDDGCWLIPFKGNVTPIPAYKGLIKVARETESVSDVQPYPIYEHDTFEYTLGLNPTLSHLPAKFGSDRGKLVGAYVVFTMPDCSKRFHVMDRHSIEKSRDVSPSYRADKTGSVWAVWEEAMFLKTVIKQGFKYIPVKAALRDLIYDDNQIEAGTKVGLLLDQSGIEGLSLEEATLATVATPPADKPDTSVFDGLVEEKLKESTEEEYKARAEHLGLFLKETAEHMTTKKNLVSTEMLMVSGGSHFEPYTDGKGNAQVGFWKKFLAWEDAPERPWKQEAAPEPPGTGVEAPKTAATGGPPPDDSPWPDATTGAETFEQRAHRVWGLVVQKYPKMVDIKANLKITGTKDLTEENIDGIEQAVTG